MARTILSPQRCSSMIPLNIGRVILFYDGSTEKHSVLGQRQKPWVTLSSDPRLLSDFMILICDCPCLSLPIKCYVITSHILVLAISPMGMRLKNVEIHVPHIHHCLRKVIRPQCYVLASFRYTASYLLFQILLLL